MKLSLTMTAKLSQEIARKSTDVVKSGEEAVEVSQEIVRLGEGDVNATLDSGGANSHFNFQELSSEGQRCLQGFWSDPPLNGLYCNASWDTLHCWPATKAGTTATEVCAAVFTEVPALKHYPEAVAYRECNDVGEWVNGGWTNYSQCLSVIEHQVGSSGVVVAVRYITFIGALLSLLTLTITIFIFTAYRTLECERLRVHRNLVVALIVRFVVMLVITEPFITHRNTLSYRDVDWACKSLLALRMYTQMASINWMFVEGLFLHTRLTARVIPATPPFPLYYTIGWGAPLVFIIWWICVMAIHHPVHCWRGYSNLNYIWILVAPMITALLINLLFLVNIIRILVTKLKAGEATEARNNEEDSRRRKFGKHKHRKIKYTLKIHRNSHRLARNTTSTCSLDQTPTGSPRIYKAKKSVLRQRLSSCSTQSESEGSTRSRESSPLLLHRCGKSDSPSTIDRSVNRTPSYPLRQSDSPTTIDRSVNRSPSYPLRHSDSPSTNDRIVNRKSSYPPSLRQSDSPSTIDRNVNRKTSYPPSLRQSLRQNSQRSVHEHTRLPQRQLSRSGHTNSVQHYPSVGYAANRPEFNIRKAIRATIVLFPLLGITNLLFAVNPGDKGDLEGAYMLTNALLQSSQGVFVSVLYCFLNTEVQEVLRKRWRQYRVRHSGPRRSNSQRRSGRTCTLLESSISRQTSTAYLSSTTHLSQPSNFPTPTLSSHFTSPAHSTSLAHYSDPTHSTSLTQYSDPTHSTSLTHYSDPTHSTSLTHYSDPAHSTSIAHYSDPTHSTSLTYYSDPAHSTSIAQYSDPTHSTSLTHYSDPAYSNSALLPSPSHHLCQFPPTSTHSITSPDIETTEV